VNGDSGTKRKEIEGMTTFLKIHREGEGKGREEGVNRIWHRL
jgi:hypothetical protein